jgi:hydroxymethylpyrimidine pyrophosphatase-like HAD family hydrolase
MSMSQSTFPDLFHRTDPEASLQFLALAVDYDETIAHGSLVAQSTVAALARLKASGRKLILVTGRELSELLAVFPEVGIFDCVVAENGALFYSPATGKEKLLAPAYPAALVARLKELEVVPLQVGRSIVATRTPNDKIALEAIKELGLEHHIVFNKGAVMILPPNVNKASGLKTALKVFNISPLQVVGVGDAENDHAFLMSCGYAVAVANAIPSLKAEVDLVLTEAGAPGVCGLIDELLRGGLEAVADARTRRRAAKSA